MPDNANVDEGKGKVKQATGDLTGDKGLKREGQVDSASGKLKKAVGDAADKVKGAVNRDRH